MAEDDLAQDVVQAAMLDIWRQVSRFDPDLSSLRSWVLSITHHKAVDAVRHEQQHRRRRSSEEWLTSLPSAYPGPEG